MVRNGDDRVPAAQLLGGYYASLEPGAVLGLAGAFFSACSTVQTRALTRSETTSSIVLYFSLICAVAFFMSFVTAVSPALVPESHK